jgi:hypothetical protein
MTHTNGIVELNKIVLQEIIELNKIVLQKIVELDKRLLYQAKIVAERNQRNHRWKKGVELLEQG